MEPMELIRLAIQARDFAHAPYSNYLCGAALLAANGEVFLGCNVENAAYSPTNCGERTAFFKAISNGVREFSTIAVMCGARGTEAESFEYAFPCGVCRQVMLEFCDADTFKILTARSEADYISRTLAELMPERWPTSPMFEAQDGRTLN